MALDDKISKKPQMNMLNLREILLVTFKCHVASRSRCFVNKVLSAADAKRNSFWDTKELKIKTIAH